MRLGPIVQRRCTEVHQARLQLACGAGKTGGIHEILEHRERGRKRRGTAALAVSSLLRLDLLEKMEQHRLEKPPYRM